ncbi:tRNA-2-methylthio-N6-dimethylallyladenosine synthase [Sporobacter termitidis DSM 10068]|uniref:tRNA-2-methylthio-N(6)-dimethylallyladenosine synthase n=1 Tax=Sporobacter termitidis DSM 10068 TaxID=1123282 RepID=A0A1M5Z7D4_9FIRM|nr:tRNA (N6-isopentenyl adenosine(37)-C2)-methylthiotransferase MiaB [Sporobacter termitidis]SHI20140.1 tRNA-2-methylthio-N6-dimethylallyladenosine synthase [Sporobacter termitidis DSM 10068]
MKLKRAEISQEDIDRQKAIMERLRAHNAGSGAAPRAFIDTYGCQQNESDSEKLRGMLGRMGYSFTDKEADADVIVINTCAVREHAEMRVYGNVGALVHTKRNKPGQIIALCGCMVQQPSVADKIRRSFRHVDLVFGPQALWRFPEYLERILTERGRIFSIEDDPGTIAEGLPVVRDGTVKAWLSIMYGCNNFCSYCIVPYVRGRERSRAPELILSEAKELIAAGYKDITLLGQNVNSYGKDLESPIDFSELLRRLNALDGEFLLRFMTSHPKDAGERLFKTLAQCEKVAHHLHLPFQAGNDRVLRAMNRGYTRTQYLELVDMARQYIPDIVLTSDVIVGFPGETEEEFNDTLAVIEKARFDALFTFIYSKREGTPACRLDDPEPKDAKQRRFDALLKLQNSISEEKHREYVGKTLRVLVDGESGDLRYPLTARTNGGRLVRLSGNAAPGAFGNARITDCNTWALFGELI